MLKAFSFLAAVLLVGAAGYFGRAVPFSEQWPMFEALRTTASIIFAVIGAWMAIIYPERLKLSFKQSALDASAAAASGTGWGQLFTPVVHSTAILCVILVVGAAVPILRHVSLPVDVTALRGSSYGLLVALTLWQLWTVLLTLVPADKVKSYLDHDDAKASRVARFKSIGISRDEAQVPRE